MAKSRASVVVVNIDGDEAQKVAQSIGNGSIGLACGVTKNEEVKKYLIVLARHLAVSTLWCLMRARLGKDVLEK